MAKLKNKTSPYQISAFTQAARSRSFSKAAAVLGVTQSSIAQHVANLERVVGAQLLIRRREGLELTRAGRELFEVSDRLRNLEQMIEEKIGNYVDLSTGYLRVVANAARPAMPVIGRYLAQNPMVQIEFGLSSWESTIRLLEARDVDVALVVEPRAADGLEIEDIGVTRYQAFVSRDHPISDRTSVSLRELAAETLVLTEDGSLTQRLVTEKMAALGLDMPRIVKTTTFPVVKEAVLHGIGVGFMLEDGQFASQTIVGLDVVEMPETYRVCMVTPAEKRGLRLVNSFCEAILDTL